RARAQGGRGCLASPGPPLNVSLGWPPRTRRPPGLAACRAGLPVIEPQRLGGFARQRVAPSIRVPAAMIVLLAVPAFSRLHPAAAMCCAIRPASAAAPYNRPDPRFDNHG